MSAPAGFAQTTKHAELTSKMALKALQTRARRFKSTYWSCLLTRAQCSAGMRKAMGGSDEAAGAFPVLCKSLF
jgi:hypothetical protein